MNVNLINLTVDQAQKVFDLIKSDPDLDSVADQITAQLPNPCPYTFSHTRHWCHYPMCRDS